MRLAWAALVGVLGTACLSPGVTDCQDGTSCPVGYICGPDNTCLSRAQLEACNGLADGDACTTAVLGAGICHMGACIVARCGNGIVEPGEVCDDGNVLNEDGCSGTCTSDESCGNGIAELDEECDCGDAERPGAASCMGTYNGDWLCSTACRRRRCGDGIVDPGEVCDDGNQTPGDGCNFSCTSDETCGNGIVDYFAGEQCDDGNSQHRDGCSATCKDEAFTWMLEPQGVTPVARSFAVMTYDIARRRTVLFGGGTSSSAGFGDTWEWDGNSWNERISRAPSPRLGAGATYIRDRLIMFGGYIIGEDSTDETWVFDGVGWTELLPAARPPARHYASIVYDAGRDRVVMFGGRRQAGYRNDTWEYDGTTWVERPLAVRPAARWLAAMAYDPSRGRTVLFGGDGAETDTWELDAAGWTQVATTGPSARVAAAMVYDANRKKVVLFGGRESSFGAPLSDTWEFDGTSWTQLTPTGGSPPARSEHAMTYDVARDRIIMFGGRSGTTNLGDTWELVGSTWTQRVSAPGPGARVGSVLVTDTARGRVLLCGGFENDTWAYDGNSWRRLTTTGPPSGGVIAYDSARRRVVSVIGRAVAGVWQGETWEYDGTTWTERTLASGSPPRAPQAMAFDAARGVSVLYGQAQQSGIFYNETWEYDGAAWVRRTLPASPTPRYRPHMAYDAGRARIVLYGGAYSNGQVNDTWEYDGTTWTNIATTASLPHGREYAAFAYDPKRRRIVLFGGYGLVDSGTNRRYLGGTWEYDGQSWTQPVVDVAPSARGKTGMAYDPATERMVLFGGTDFEGTPFAETWSLGYAALGPSEACLSGIDFDGDGAIGCDDEDCWGMCAPMCSPGTPPAACSTSPRCGDGVCSALENCRSCPQDCAVGTLACPIRCGDFACDAPETALTCPGDC